MGKDHRPAKPVNAASAAFQRITRLRQRLDLSAQFLDSEAGLV